MQLSRGWKALAYWAAAWCLDCGRGCVRLFWVQCPVVAAIDDATRGVLFFTDKRQDGLIKNLDRSDISAIRYGDDFFCTHAVNGVINQSITDFLSVTSPKLVFQQSVPNFNSIFSWHDRTGSNEFAVEVCFDRPNPEFIPRFPVTGDARRQLLSVLFLAYRLSRGKSHYRRVGLHFMKCIKIGILKWTNQ